MDETIGEQATERRDRSRQLVGANADPDASAYSVAHDPRVPLQAMDRFTAIVLRDDAHKRFAAFKRLHRADEHEGTATPEQGREDAS